MDDDRITGAARKLGGKAEAAVVDAGNYLGDQAKRLLDEHVTPALSSAAETAEGYARQARSAVVDRSGQVSDLVRGHPLLAVGLVAAAGYLLARLTGGRTYGPPRR